MSAFEQPSTPKMQWHDVEDAVLLDRAASDSLGAVDEFVARFGDRLCSYLIRLVRDRSWAEDLVQEALLRALAEANRYDAQWPVHVWMLRIARNLALDLLRSEAGRRLRNEERASAAVLAAPSALATAQHREFQTALEAALQHLPEEFRSVFLLRDGESLSYSEIGEVLGISSKTVSSRLHRARQQLRALLRDYLDR